MVDMTLPPDNDKSNQMGNGLPYGASTFVTHSKPKSRKKLYISLVIAVILLFALTMWLLIINQPNKTQEIANETANEPTVVEPPKDIPDAGSLTEHSNGFLGLKLTHPDSWTATDADNGLRIQSPEFKYQSMSGGEITGYFRIYIRKGARTQDGKYIGRGIAIEPSQKLTYTNPSPGQRSETNLSLFGLDDSSNYGFFMIAGNFNLNKGDTLGPKFGQEPDTYIISGGYSDDSLTDDMATNPVSPQLIKTSNAYSQAVEIIKSLNLR